MLRTLLSWSGGKDAYAALLALRTTPGVEVTGLFTTVNQMDQTVPVHGIPLAAVEAQARSLGLPHTPVMIPWPCPNHVYSSALLGLLRPAEEAGVTNIAFGDLFLEDIRNWRVNLINATTLVPLFPVWGRDTSLLARELIGQGMEAIVCAVETAVLPASLAGAAFDEGFLAALPPGVDPCGERGEFHTFVCNGPGFRTPVRVAIGNPRQSGSTAWVEVTVADDS